ncbi:MAG: glutathione S-transferase family protein [Ramlibacter sp.]|nr:glutathione S-transferase family protein [Ramlibacter sp.]
MIDLYHRPGSAAMAPHIVLQALALPHRLVPVDTAAQAHKTPAYLALNPNGLVPVLVDHGADGGPLVLYEAAAICLYLADAHPEAGLMPPVGSVARARATQWLVWLTNTLQATLIHFFYPERLVDASDTAAAAQVRRAVEARVGTLLDQIETQLASQPGPWLLGAGFGVVDIYTMMLCRWTRNFARPARSLPHTGAYLQRVLARPEVRRVFEIEQLAEPWV